MIRRQIQLVGHCGPCTVVMLLSHLGFECTQQRLASAAAVDAVIAEEGSRLDQLRDGVLTIAPDIDLLLRFRSDLDLVRKVLELGYPVGVEWQCTFTHETGNPFDTGHYSVIVDIGETDIRIVDPDDQSEFSNGSIERGEFLRRWWEDNVFLEREMIRSHGAAFVLVRNDDTRRDMLAALGFMPATYEYVRSGGAP